LTAWLPWIYQYGVGGLAFIGTIIAAFRTGALRSDRAQDRRLLAVLTAGYLGFALVHALWILAAQG